MTEAGSAAATPGPAWPVLIVDDDPSVHAVTRLCLHGYMFHSRPLEWLSAHSAAEGRTIMAARKNTQSRSIENRLIGVGEEPARSDILYFLVEQMQKHALEHHVEIMPSLQIFKKDASDIQVAKNALKLLESDDYKFMREEIIAATVAAVNTANKDETRITKSGVEHILDGSELPAIKIAAAMRDIVRKKDAAAVADFDRAYFCARIKQDKPSGPQER